MQKTFTIKYDKKVCHGIKFELGNGKYHSLNFLLKKQSNRILLEKGSLFLEKITRAQTVDSIFQFKRKVKEQFINKDAIWFEYDRTFDIFDSSFYLTRISGYAGFSDNVSASTNRINKSGISNNLINFYIGEPQKNIYHLDNISINKDDKSTRLEEREKRIDYSISNVDINDVRRLKEKNDNKYKANINECIPAKNETGDTFINDSTIKLKNKTKHGYKNKEISLLRDVNDLYRDYSNKLAKIEVPNIFINNNIQGKFRDKKLSNMGDFYLLENLTPNICINEEKHIKAGFDKTIYMNKINVIETRDKCLHGLDGAIHTETDANKVNDIFSETFISKLDSAINFESANKSLHKRNIGINPNLSGLEIKNLNNKIMFYESDFINKGNSRIDMNEENLSLSKCRSVLNDIYTNSILASKHSHRIKFYYDIKQLSKIRPNLFTNDTSRSLTKIKREISKQDLLSAKVRDYKLTVGEHYKNVKVSNRNICINKKDLLLDNAYYKDIIIGVGQTNMSLYDREINYHNNTVILNLDSRSINPSLNSYFVKKDALSVFQDDTHLDIVKAASSISVDNNFLNVSKYYAPIVIEDDYIHMNKYYKPFFFTYDYIWINKRTHTTRIDDIYINVQKSMHHSMMNDDYISINKNIHHTRIDEYKDWISKSMKHSMIDDELILVAKSMKHSMIDDELILVAKSMYHTGIDDEYLNINKLSKGISSSGNILVNRVAKAIETYHDEAWIYKQSKRMQDVNTILGVNKSSKPAILYDTDILVKYGSRRINNNLDSIMIDAYSKPIHEMDNITASDATLEAAIMDFVNLDEKIQHAWFYDYSKMLNRKTEDGKFNEHINLDSSVNFGMPDEEGTFVGKKIKDTNLFLTGEFVTAIHYDENEKPSLDDNGNIDELLLPHKDYKYSDFIKKLINEDGTVNFKYVKEYDAKTGEYTVSIPVENPIEIYANIGRDYLDLDVSTLELVVYIVKNIWKDNMFRYTSMSAQDSLKDMLVKLDHTLNNQYDLNKKKSDEAKRCIQLFRWYSEMAILNNCDYVLKFDTKKVAVDYYNKDLGELVNNIEFTNMHISDEYIIEPIVAKDRASITFKNNAIVPGPPLKLSFKLYNINTSSSISIIEDGQTKVLTYKEGIHDLSFDLKEKIILNFTPLNQNQSINVANLFIDNISMRGFTVTYKGRFGEINSVMQEMLDNMLVIGDVPESIKEKLKDVAPVTAAVDRLLQYFELHHKEKLKGKRLITKK